MNLPARTGLFKNKPPDTARGGTLLDATVYYADTFFCGKLAWQVWFFLYCILNEILKESNELKE
jgi:hypothetical protein